MNATHMLSTKQRIRQLQVSVEELLKEMQDPDEDNLKQLGLVNSIDYPIGESQRLLDVVKQLTTHTEAGHADILQKFEVAESYETHCTHTALAVDEDAAEEAVSNRECDHQELTDNLEHSCTDVSLFTGD